MSVRVMSAVFEHDFQPIKLPNGGTVTPPISKLVMLALADHANDDGISAYPGRERIQKKTGLSSGAISKAIKGLRLAGYLSKNGRSRYNTTNHELNLSMLTSPGDKTEKEETSPGEETFKHQVIKDTSPGEENPSLHELNHQNSNSRDSNPASDGGASDFSKLVKIYEDNINLVVPMIAEELRDALALYPLEWCEQAILESVKAGVRNWNYTAAILARWKKDGRRSRRGNGKAGPARNLPDVASTTGGFYA